MKKLLVVMSLTALVLGLQSCTKGCRKDNIPGETPPPIENKADHEEKVIEEKPNAEANAESAKEATENMDKQALMNEFNLKAGEKLYADIDTSEGKIKAELFWEKAPMTVRNFVELALGKKEWTDPATGQKSSKPLYNGTIFHRVIKGFMIQGGDPTGTGMGGPGYRFKDEFHPDLKHDKKGILSMANAGPNSNGSQFFIMEEPKSHLDNRHSVFGEASDPASQAVISKIASVPTNKANDKPITDVKITNITISKG